MRQIAIAVSALFLIVGCISQPQLNNYYGAATGRLVSKNGQPQDKEWIHLVSLTNPDNKWAPKHFTVSHSTLTDSSGQWKIVNISRGKYWVFTHQKPSLMILLPDDFILIEPGKINDFGDIEPNIP